MTRRRRAVVVVLVAALVISGCSKTTHAVAPFVSDPNNPTKQDTHWHAALGVYDCDHWMGDSPGSGVWKWPASTAEGNPARVSAPNVYAGLHSHDDGVIHMEAVAADEAGRNATVGKYFEFGGWKLSATGYSFLGTTVQRGAKCGTTPGVLSWEVGSWNGDATGKQKYTLEVGNPASWKLNQYEVVVIAFLAQGTSISTIGDPPSVPNLATALGVEGTTTPVFTTP